MPSLVGGGTEGHACYDAGARDQVSTFLSGGKPDCQVVSKQINDLVFSWFRIGWHRVPEAVIVVGAVAELTSRQATGKLLATTSTMPRILARAQLSI